MYQALFWAVINTHYFLTITQWHGAYFHPPLIHEKNPYNCGLFLIKPALFGSHFQYNQSRFVKNIPGTNIPPLFKEVCSNSFLHMAAFPSPPHKTLNCLYQKSCLRWESLPRIKNLPCRNPHPISASCTKSMLIPPNCSYKTANMYRRKRDQN